MDHERSRKPRPLQGTKDNVKYKLNEMEIPDEGNFDTLLLEQYTEFRGDSGKPSDNIHAAGPATVSDVFVVRKTEEWRSRAACRKEDLSEFYISGDTRKEETIKAIKIAQAVCEGCMVKAECLKYALDQKESNGIWGGVNMDKPKRRTKRD